MFKCSCSLLVQVSKMDQGIFWLPPCCGVAFFALYITFCQNFICDVRRSRSVCDKPCGFGTFLCLMKSQFYVISCFNEIYHPWFLGSRQCLIQFIWQCSVSHSDLLIFFLFSFFLSIFSSSTSSGFEVVCECRLCVTMSRFWPAMMPSWISRTNIWSWPGFFLTKRYIVSFFFWFCM